MVCLTLGCGGWSVCLLSDGECCCGSVSVMLGPVSCPYRSVGCGLMSSLGKDAVRGSEGVACGGGVGSVVWCVFAGRWLLPLVPLLCCVCVLWSASVVAYGSGDGVVGRCWCMGTVWWCGLSSGFVSLACSGVGVSGCVVGFGVCSFFTCAVIGCRMIWRRGDEVSGCGWLIGVCAGRVALVQCCGGCADGGCCCGLESGLSVVSPSACSFSVSLMLLFVCVMPCEIIVSCSRRSVRLVLLLVCRSKMFMCRPARAATCCLMLFVVVVASAWTMMGWLWIVEEMWTGNRFGVGVWSIVAMMWFRGVVTPWSDSGVSRSSGVAPVDARVRCRSTRLPGVISNLAWICGVMCLGVVWHVMWSSRCASWSCAVTYMMSLCVGPVWSCRLGLSCVVSAGRCLGGSYCCWIWL